MFHIFLQTFVPKTQSLTRTIDRMYYTFHCVSCVAATDEIIVSMAAGRRCCPAGSSRRRRRCRRRCGRCGARSRAASWRATPPACTRRRSGWAARAPAGVAVVPPPAVRPERRHLRAGVAPAVRLEQVPAETGALSPVPCAASGGGRRLQSVRSSPAYRAASSCSVPFHDSGGTPTAARASLCTRRNCTGVGSTGGCTVETEMDAAATGDADARGRHRTATRQQ